MKINIRDSREKMARSALKKYQDTVNKAIAELTMKLGDIESVLEFLQNKGDPEDQYGPFVNKTLQLRGGRCRCVISRFGSLTFQPESITHDIGGGMGDTVEFEYDFIEDDSL